MSIADICWA